LLYLAGLPFVDMRRVGVVGFSQGGGAALSVAETRPFELFVNPEGRRFQAAVAFYPPCKYAGGRPGIPTLVLVGEADDWTPAIDCKRTIARWGQIGAPVELITFPGAFHSFNVDSPGRRGTLGH
jgi:dienelactone hydrolase